jgi:hypothetical protein
MARLLLQNDADDCLDAYQEEDAWQAQLPIAAAAVGLDTLRSSGYFLH